ncbi:O-antigen ligase family protein [Microbacterium ulmi]|uniref:O-antigen ligase family protein n=1 Tax=Microbacterium ulmi TaxID=179095 RepID=A0A7Y2PZG2_9MICO|nr:O-antigen ligase family protein [Microbacterium ulmi]NII69764.1 O-antigen ligase [Microbacterium ulmi]NNH03263.1 O-antigen ligase family protein [Microbacterium ulmi]
MGMTHAVTRVRAALPLTVGLIALAVVGAVVGVLTARDSSIAVPAAVGVLVVGIAATDLTLVPMLAVPATLVMVRVGGALSVSDVVLALATAVSLLLIKAKDMRPMQPLIWAGIIYLASAIPVQILYAYPENIVEWAHEVVLVLGSMIVGFAIGRTGKARAAMGIYALACIGIAIAAMIATVVSLAQYGVLSPAYLPYLHKNTIGGMLAIAAVVAFARPVWLGWSRRWSYTVLAICSLGMLAAQSRQGLVGAVIGVLFIALRPRPQSGKRSRWIWLSTIPVGIYVISQVVDQLASDNTFNSAHQRLTWYEDTFNVWITSPVFGVGLRWWYTDRFTARFQPPNVELEVLSSVGVVGLIGFLLMFAVALWALIKMDPVYGTVGAAVVLTRFAQAQFDLYWVAGQASLLWIIAGICYGVQAHDRAAQASGRMPEHRRIASSTRRARGAPA